MRGNNLSWIQSSDLCLRVHLGVSLYFQMAVFTILAEVLAPSHLTVGSLFFPARLGAANVISAVHAMRTSLHLPTWIELEVVAYGRYVQPLICQTLNKSQPFQVIVGVESPATSPSRMYHSMLFPHPDGFRMNTQHFCDNTYRVNVQSRHDSSHNFV